jgi:putative endonuclease
MAKNLLPVRFAMKSQKKIKWTVYIIEAQNGRFYTGITTQIERRFEEHQKSPKGAKFFRLSKAKKLVYVRSCPNRSQASKREAKIKKMTRKEKLKLIK